MTGGCGAGLLAGINSALLGVTGSLLGVTSLQIRFSNFCCTGVAKSPSSSFNDFSNLVASASTDKDAGSCLNFLMYNFIDGSICLIACFLKL